MKEAGINRSPSAYLLNPAEERARYPSNVDTQMTLLRFVDHASGKSVGAFNWHATHGTSMSRENKLISGDNKGVAARLFEDLFASQTNSSSSNTNSTVPGIFVNQFLEIFIRYSYKLSKFGSNCILILKSVK